MALFTADIVLTASAASIITSGPSDSFLILKATVCNTDTTARSVSVYRVPPAGTADATMLITDASGASAFIIGPGETQTLPISGQRIVGRSNLQALASITSVVVLSATWTTVT